MASLGSVSMPSFYDRRDAKGTDGRDRFQAYWTVGNALALLIALAAFAEFVRNAWYPTDRDFISFWGAARLALAGKAAAAYDNAALHAVQAAAATFGSGEMPFPYPPAFLLLILPFGLLSFPAAMAVWSLSTAGFYVFAARRLYPESGWLALAFPAVFANAAIGQNAFLTAGLFMAGLSLLEAQPFAAGLLFGCLVIKPQLALMIPIALLAGGRWRAIAGAIASSTGVIMLGWLAFGTTANLAWLHQMPLYASIARNGLVGWHKLASVYAAARQLGLNETEAIGLHAVVAFAAAAAVWRIWRLDADFLCKAAVLTAATMLASPYVFFYDAPILVAAFFWLAHRGVRPAWLGLLWCLPLVTIAQVAGLGGAVNLNPVVPIALVVLIYRGWQRDSSAEEVSIARIGRASPAS